MRLLQRADSELITDGSLVGATLALAMPMLLSAVLQNVQSLIDLFWVGRLGHEAVAAVAMAATILMLLYPMLMGLSTGTVALVSRAVGSGRMEEASAAATQSLLLSLVLGTLSALVGWFAAAPLFKLLGAEPDVARDGIVYLRIFLAGSFTVYLLFIGNAALQGAGDAHTPMYVMMAANLLNIVLDPLLIFGIGPFPRMGVAGAAMATVISQALAASIALRVLLRGRSGVHARPAYWKPDLGMSWRILRIGIPGSGQMLSRSLMSLVLMGIVATSGTAAVAAYGTGLRFHYIILMPAFALGGAAATMMGQNLGAGKPARARKAVWVATWMDVGIMVLSSVALILLAPNLIALFNRDPEVVNIGARYLRIVSVFYVFAALGIVIGRGLNGAGDTVGPMVITIAALWGLQVPLAAWLSRMVTPPTDGVWWAISAAFVAQGLMVVLWFELGRWKHKRV